MRIGIDLGGTKIEIAVLGADGAVLHRERVETPAGDYAETIEAIKGLVIRAEAHLGTRCSVGIGIPGAISPATGLVKNANSVALNGHPFNKDVSAALGRTVRVANDANCFTLSEATDGAGAGKAVVFGVIAGTGVGGGIAINGRVLTGPHAIAGEWGHNSLPFPHPSEVPGPRCHCKRPGCIEAFCSGPAVERDYHAKTGTRLHAGEIAQAAERGDAAAAEIMELLFDRLARALASIVNVLDPDVIVMGGGVSNIDALYQELPKRIPAYVFSDVWTTPVLKNVHGDSSGVRGAAWLWKEMDREIKA